ncbi:MAG: T9SS type A sorting domain-containing protein [bacterium]|nr:T9SS type A sorting domain-containing protein [bacterium]
MKKLLRFVLPVLVIAVVAGSVIVNTDMLKQQPEQKKPAKKLRGSKEDPDARARYEWNRLKDPATNTIPSGIREMELAYAKTLPARKDFETIKLGKGASTAAFGTWAKRGPYNVGGRTRALALDVDNENNILAGGITGGMFRSTDGGATWTKTTSASSHQSVTALIQDTRTGKRSTWYYATGERDGSAGGGGSATYLGNGIFKSTDSGVSWSVISSTATTSPQTYSGVFEKVFSMAIDVSNTTDDEIYAATGYKGGIMRSTNGGTSWTNVIDHYAYYSEVAATSTGVIYATCSSDGNSKGIFRSTDGVTWTDITSGGFPSTYSRIVIGIAPSNENIVYFLAHLSGSGASNHAIWKYTYSSGDGSGAGGTWVDRSANMPTGSDNLDQFDSQSAYDLLVSVKPDNPDVVFIGGTSLFRSTDGFATTGNTTRIGGYSLANSNASYANHHPDIHSNVFSTNTATMYSGHDGGISKTTNNLAGTVVWSELNNGYYTTQFYTVAIDHGTSGDNFVVGGMQDNGTYMVNSTSSTATWNVLDSGDGAYCFVVDGGGRAYSSSQNGNTTRYALKSDKSGYDNWTRIDPDVSTHLFIHPFVLDKTDQKIMYYPSGAAVWRCSDLTLRDNYLSTKSTTNWTELTTLNAGSGSITALDVSKTGGSTLYYGTDGGKVFKAASANTGTPAKTEITGSGFPSGAYVSCIVVNPSDANKVMVVFSNYSVKSLFYTEDGGSNWTDVSGNLESSADGTGTGPSTRWAAMLNISGQTVYFVAASTGLYSTKTLDGTSTSWTQEGASTIGNVVIDMIDVRQSPDYLVVVGTHGNGIYSTNIVESSVPVEMSSFNYAMNEDAVKVEWETQSEINNYGFEVERSFDGVKYKKIGFIEGNGTSNLVHTYQFIDKDKSSGTRYYRLKQIDYNGMFKYTEIIKVEIAVPDDYALEQNFPNPFNPSTEIKYSLPEESFVTIDVYSITGRKVKALVSKNHLAGRFSAVWDGRNETGVQVSSGTYIYRIRAGSFNAVKKMVFIK